MRSVSLFDCSAPEYLDYGLFGNSDLLHAVTHPVQTCWIFAKAAAGDLPQLEAMMLLRA